MNSKPLKRISSAAIPSLTRSDRGAAEYATKFKNSTGVSLPECAIKSVALTTIEAIEETPVVFFHGLRGGMNAGFKDG